jgi:preprotein translocase subunit YajC
MVEVTYQMVLSTIQTIALIVGIAYYMTISRKQQRTRELALESQEQAWKAQENALET